MVVEMVVQLVVEKVDQLDETGVDEMAERKVVVTVDL